MRNLLPLAAALALTTAAQAHEGHAPLPTKGATVRGDQLTLSATAAQAIAVKVEKVELSRARRLVQCMGAVELPWSQQALVASLIPGKVTQVLVKPGQSVRAGQELARIESVELEHLQFNLLEAYTELSFGSQLLGRHEELGAGNVIPGRTLLETRTSVLKGRARYHCARQKLLALGLADDVVRDLCRGGDRIGAIAIVSPIAGTIAAVGARPGQMVEPTEHLFRVVDPARVWVVGKVLEADAGKMRAGLPVQVHAATIPGGAFTALIEHVDQTLAADRTLAVKARVPNPDGSLKPGMFCRMDIESTADEAVVAPKRALFYDRLQAFALVREAPGNFLRKRVETGQEIGEGIEIADGLFPGDKVVTTGVHELAALFAGDPASWRPAREGTPTADVPPRAASALGRIEVPSDKKLLASAPIAGRITRIVVEHGQLVGEGQLLGELQSLELHSLKLELVEARANLAQASTSVTRLESIASTSAIAHKDLWELRRQRDVANHAVESLRRKLSVIGLADDEIRRIEETDIAELETAGELSSVLPIRAPGAGRVADFDLLPGQVVERRQSLFEIHNAARVWVRAYLFEQDAVGIDVGLSARVSFVADPASRATGAIDRIAPVLVSGNRALSVWIELDNPSGQLRENMSAVVVIGSGTPHRRPAAAAD